MTISEEAVKAMPERIYAVKRTEGSNCVVSFDTPSLDYNVEYVRADLAPFLPVQGAVKKLEWGNARITEDGREAEDAESPVGRYIATDTGWFLLGRTGYEVERGLYQAKAAAQADYEARIRSAIETVISVSEPSAARELALEEAAQIAEDYVQYDVATAIRALSSPDHADAGKVDGDGNRWRIFEAACARGYWGIELEQASNDDEPILYPIKVHRDTLVRIVESHNSALPSAPSQEVAGS